MESRNDNLLNIPKSYWIWSYVGAWKGSQFPHLGTFYICKNSSFSEEMLIEHDHRHTKINRFDMRIS